MRPTLLITTVVLTAVFSAFLDLDSASAIEPNEIGPLRSALDDLDQWIGDAENGAKWRSFLKTSELSEQIDKGLEADPAIVSRVLQQYRSGATGLNKRRFIAVRQQLQSWLDALRNQHGNNLAKHAWAARGDHIPLDDKSFGPARANLRDAANQLKNRLGRDSSFALAWKDYLRWSLLEPHFSDEVKLSRQTLQDLDSVLRRIRTNKPGLEHPVFVRTAEAIERYRELAFWYALGKGRDTRPYYANSLLKLEKQITRNLEKPTVESSRQIGKVLGIMHHLGHSPSLVQRISRQFSQPNVQAQVSSKALQRVAQRPVNETSPVVDVILGAQVRGTANSSGVLSLRTLPANDHIAVELQLAGNIQSRTFSYKKPVRVGSLGSTNFISTKHLQISDERFLVLPAAASARTKTRIRSVKKTGGKFGHRIIEKIARKKVAESKPQAEYIAARHAECQIAEKFDRQVVDALYEARQNYDNKLHPPLERIGMFPEDLHMSSSASGIQIATKLASYEQISTDRLPPGIRTDNDLSLQVHESALNNLLPHFLAGAVLGQQSEDEPPKIEGDVPAWLKKLGNDPKVEEQFAKRRDATAGDQTEIPEFKPWQFVLNSEHPVSVSFNDQKLTVRIRIAELKTLEDGEESIRKNWDFLVTYLAVQEGNRIVLYREGDIEVLPTDFDPEWFGDPRWDDKLTAKQVGIRKNLEGAINQRAADGQGFPLEIALPPVELPSASGIKQTLMLQQFDCDEGWLTLGYRLP